MKINPFLEEKLFGLSANEYLGIATGAIFGTASDEIFTIESTFWKFIVFILAWILGIVVYTVIIALIKTYITKED